MPRHVRPMLATPSEHLPRDMSRYGFEFKWDGIRAICYVEGGEVKLESRNLLDITRRYPELQALGEAVKVQPAVLDGEIVAFGPDGRPSFQALQGRMNIERAGDINVRLVESPVTYFLFDLLYLAGRSLLSLPYSERRKLLEELELDGPRWKTPISNPAEGEETFQASKELGLEGVVAKRLDSPYQPGLRTGAWLKIKNHLSQEFVIGGWTRGAGVRSGTVGALLIGYYDRRPDAGEQKLIYAGRVGTGFTDRFLATLSPKLDALARATNPFSAGPALPPNPVFVEPQLVCEVEFTEWTRDLTLRHPSFKGLRDDKDPHDVVLESASAR